MEKKVWHYKELYQIVKKNSAIYPHSFSAIHSDTPSLLSNRGYHWPPCARFAVVRMFFKMWWYGCTSKKNDIERLVCVTEKAGFMDLPQECITCLTMSKMTAKSAFSECLGGIQNQMNVPGLLVLSKRKLRNSKMVYFRSNVKELLPRGYLRVEVPEVGTIACTHTTANLGKVYYEPNLKSVFKSWEQQNLEETRILIQHLSAYPRTIVMGDLNSSPTVPNKHIQGDFEGALNLFKASNYTTPYIDLWGQCTFCSGNNLVPYRTDWILDHILIRGLKATQAKRVMDRIIPNHKVHPSDHYGIQVVL
uniref:Uncharacterized protein LOC111132504 n=1 Tax=Crassostrea virginica TaxID=6565 RepID=A0A8B8E8M7_CRAVI|nr:uncharacterized protein LOC111132504 [Crassostrea virginica]